MFYIRADANEIIGAGHIMRCIAVAAELRKNLEEVVFIVADQYGHGIVESYGFKTLCLNSQWDNLEMELGIILPLVKENHVKGILVDSYYVTENYLAELHQCTRVAYIDDVDAFIYPVDLVVNYNIYDNIRQQSMIELHFPPILCYNHSILARVPAIRKCNSYIVHLA